MLGLNQQKPACPPRVWVLCPHFTVVEGFLWSTKMKNEKIRFLLQKLAKAVEAMPGGEEAGL